MGVKMPRAVVMAVFEEFHQEEAPFLVLRSEAQVLVVFPRFLPVQVDVKELAAFQRLGDGMMKIEARHGLVRIFGIDAHHFRMIQRFDKCEHRPGRGKIDVAPGLVGFSLEGELHAVFVVGDIAAQKVDAFAEALDRVARIPAGIRLDPFPPSPEDIDPRAQLVAEIDRVHGLAHGVSPHFRIVGREGAVLENGMVKEIRRGHGDFHVAVFHGFLEFFHNLVTLRGRGVDRHEIVVMQVHAISAQLGEFLDDPGRRDRRPDRIAKRIAAPVPDGPEAESELVFRFGLV